MDGVRLLHQAQAAGLHVEAAGNQLKIRGPKRAEPLVRLLAEHKPAVLAALVRPPSAWEERYTALTFEWSIGRRPWPEARRLAWGGLQNDWHRDHGPRWPRWQCAGCHAPIGGLAGLDLPDGSRVHFDNINCLITFGRHWRGKAHDQLVALGLEPPADHDDI
jgi:hypothetical protein